MSNLNGNKAVEAVNRVPNERLEDLFREAILAKMDDASCAMRFQEFDLDIRKEVGQPVLVDMTVFGMADDTTKDTFVTKDASGNDVVISGGGSVSVTLDDDSVVKFVFSAIVNLNATDYLVTYRLS